MNSQENSAPGSELGSLKTRIAGCLVILILLAAAAGGWAFIRLRREMTRPVEHPSADRVISIEPGKGTRAIVDKLAEAGIIKHPREVMTYLTVTGRTGHLRAGDYKFPSPISPAEALDRIRRGDVYFERVTIPEGYNRFEIADLLAEKTGKASSAEFLNLMNDSSLVSQIAPEARSLEGYLFPDTYNYTTKTTAEDLVRAMVRRFDDVFTPEWSSRASQLGMSVSQIVTLASIIEKEAKVPADRPLMASVFYNRLRIGMPLGSDPTFIYAAILAGDYDGNPNQPRHRRRDSRYNTYIYPGLPPGPIASPGRASLEAALYPASSDYLYFVLAGADGHHKFSRSASEHDAAVSEYRRQQKQWQQ